MRHLANLAAAGLAALLLTACNKAETETPAPAAESAPVAEAAKPEAIEPESAPIAVTAAQKADLVDLLKEIDASVESGDTVRMKAAMAPRDYKVALGTAMGVPAAQMDVFLTTLDATLDQAFSMSTFHSHDVDYDAITYTAGKGGLPVAVIPFAMEMTVNGDDYRSSGNYYAVRRTDRWLSLAPTDANATAMLLRAFPELTTIGVQTNTITPVSGG